MPKSALSFNPKPFGLALRRTRLAQGMAQNDLAKRLGISNKTLCNIETGLNGTNLALYKKICSVLKLPKPALL